jgi:hypothetical protein
MKYTDFHTVLSDLGIAETRISSLIEALSQLHQSLSLLDDENIEKLQQIGSLDKLFDMYLQSCKVSKKISLRKLKLWRNKN